VNRVNKIKQEQNDGHWNFMRFRSDAYDAGQALERIAFADGALSTMTKELMAVGISIQAGSEAAIERHIERAAAQGASFEAAVEAVEVGIAMGGGLAAASAHFAFQALDRAYPREILKL
jgi:alkylhydroperoxidase/carboxymuconolactone decarboxylase family protein YurZ